jgi:sigma-B regulation protein RsbU (phosphoserine phosphatase)
MLELKDFYHLQQIESVVSKMAASEQGLVVVAGPDPRPLVPADDEAGFLPSGRQAIFRILMHESLQAHPGTRAIVVAESGDAVRVPRAWRRRIRLVVAPDTGGYGAAIAGAGPSQNDLLVVDRLAAESAPAALEAALGGRRVLSQVDTIFRGAEVARHLRDLGVPDTLLAGLSWILSVQRLPALCAYCREPDPPDPLRLAELVRRYPDLGDLPREGPFYRAPGCAHCHHTGREGEVMAFDVFYSGGSAAASLEGPSLLSLEAYILGLAARGYVSLDDLLRLEFDRLRRTYHLLTLSERAFADVKQTLGRRLAELEAANRVLQQRTEALVSLESVGQALIASRGLDELAAQFCRHARDLCGADRSILYFLRPEQGVAEVLSVSGWDAAVLHQPLDSSLVLDRDAGTEPVPFNQWPPGVPHRPTDVTAEALRAGLRVPLVAQGEHVGLMIVHTSRKSRFAPGEVALLQTFANQAAVAIQRAGLVEALQQKIVELEAAQAELVQKERLERELELARQVQQSVLPRIFPMVPGYTFAAHNQPARQVGGDFYDVILLDAGRFGIVVGDVSDKGMPAALYMALTRSLLLAEARRRDPSGLSDPPSPRAVLRSVHRLLQELGQPGLFVTVFYGVVDAAARRLVYARAAHDRPLLLRGQQVLSLGGEGTVLGFPELDELNLSEEHMDLQRGDRLVLYTDGLTDILAPNGRAFGIQRLMDLLRSEAHLAPEALCAATFAALRAYQDSATQYDDMTMLVVEVS